MTSAPKPNVLIIVTDQQRVDTIAAYGASHMRTPNIDRLAHEGALFERGYCANPICTPARASLFSGNYVHTHGAWNIGLDTPSDTVMLSHRLNDAGYRTHYIGKLHFQNGEKMTRDVAGGKDVDWKEFYRTWNGPYYGWQTIESTDGHTTFGLANSHYGVWLHDRVTDDEERKHLTEATLCAAFQCGVAALDWNLPTRLTPTTWVGERAEAFIKSRDKDEPFFLTVSFPDPHMPFAVPKDYENRVPPEDVPLPRYTEGELLDKPPHFKAVREGDIGEGTPWRGEYYFAGQWTGTDYRKISEEDARLNRSYYYTMVQSIDDEVGRILSALDDEGIADDTIVFFTTDHGELLGDHGIWEKGALHYEELVRIPYLVRFPNAFKGGIRTDALAGQVDVVPTVLDAIGDTKGVREVDGESLLPLLRGEEKTFRDYALVEHVDDPSILRLKTIVTARYKLTHYHGQPFGELYDLEVDPHEVTNRWNDKAYAGVKAELLGKVLDAVEPLEFPRRPQRYANC